MNVLEAIKGRRSIRKFKPAALARAQLEALLEAARWAPTAGNIQPWAFVVVTSPETKRALAAGAYNQRFVAEAPAVIGVVITPPADPRYAERGTNLYAIQDTAAAVQNILLAAHAMGLGTCWVGAFDDAAVAQALELKPGERPVALIPVGEPAAGGTSARRPVAEISRWLE